MSRLFAEDGGVTMAQLFGDFLVSSGLITADRLLEALICQLRSTPSTAEVLYTSELVPKTDQLRVLAHQQRTGLDYRSSAKDLGVWNPDLGEKVSQEIRRVRRPLGEILIELGYLTADSLGKALDHYVEASSKPVPSDASIQSAKPFAPSGVFGALDPVLSHEYAANLFDKILPSLRQLVDKASAAGKAVGLEAGNKGAADANLPDLMRGALSQYSALKTAAGFLQAPRSLELATELVAAMTMVRDNQRAMPSHDFLDLLRLSVHVFDGLGQLIKEFNSEDGMEQDSNLCDLSSRLNQRIVDLKAKSNVKKAS